MFVLALILYFFCIAVQESQRKKAKMKNAGNKGLLIPWLRTALDEELYEGLRWKDKQQKIFYIVWTHKSAEQWSDDVLEPFIAWAEYKGKRGKKNGKQLKATFRCALNSKRDELREIKREKNQRYWQFIDGKSGDEKYVTKKKRKLNNKLAHGMHVESNNSGCNSSMNTSSSTLDSSSEDFFPSSEEKTSKKRKHKANSTMVDNTPSSTSSHDVNDVFTKCLSSVQNKNETDHSRTDKLPPFQSLCGFQPLTPPYQDNEIISTSTEYSVDFSTPDASRLTPPVDIPPKNYSITSQYNSYHHQLNTDVYRPNCWAITSPQRSFNNLNSFSSDFDEMGEIANQHLRKSKMDLVEMDQFVPIMNMDNQVFFRDEQFNYPCKTVQENSLCEQVKLDDDLFSSYVNPEACEKIIQELNRISSSPEIDSFIYSS